MAIQMKDGSTVNDPRLGRLAQFDEESRKYNITNVLKSQVIFSHSWSQPIRLDQSNTSACTGNARTYDLAGDPVPVKNEQGKALDENFAQWLYHQAQLYDEWPGSNYEGSSVLGAIKALKANGYKGEYHWAFKIFDMCVAIGQVAPVVAGTVWYNSMFDPGPSGRLIIDPQSGEAGGHSYIIPRIAVGPSAKRAWLGPDEKIRDVPLLGILNSWGVNWGHRGQAWIWADDYEKYLMPGGEQCITTIPFHR